MARAVIFDLGGVLIDWNPRYLYRSLFAEEAEMERFLAEVCPPAWNLSLDAGRPFEEAIAERVRLFPAEEARIRAWGERWPEMLQGPIEGTVAVLEALRERGVPLYALTNWSAETYPHAEARFPFLAWFESVLVSGREKLVKPNPAIYRRLLERERLTPAETLFVDDAAANVEGARAVGLQAHHFVSPEALREELRRRGLL